jgi:hypothetical protein
MGDTTTTAGFPRQYRIRTGWRLAMLGFAAIFCGIAGVLWVFEMRGMADNPDHWIVLVAVMAVPLVLGIGSLLYGFGSRPVLILQPDTIELKNVFSTRRLHRQDIAGRRIHNQGYALYEIVLESANPSLKPVRISSVLARDEALNDWLGSLADLDKTEEQTAVEEVAADPALEDTPAERLERLENARLIALALNILGVAVAGWVWFYPTPYDLAMIAAVVLPLSAPLILGIWPHIFRLDGREKDQHAQLFGLFFLPGFALLIRALLDIDLLDWRMPLVAGVLAGVAIAVISVVAGRQAPQKAGALVATIFLMFPYGYGATQFGNRFFDDTAPQQFLATVQGKRVSTGKVTTYHIKLGAWGPHDGVNEISVPQEDYNFLGTRNAVCVHVNSGALGMPYQRLVHRSQCEAEAKAPGPQKERSLAKNPVAPEAVATSSVGAGMAAYQRGDYGEALALFSKPAAAGKPEAQFMLGLLHWQGSGTPKNTEKALGLFH